MNHYLNSNFHRYGCIAAIIGCVFVLLGWSIHWLPMLILMYIFGGVGSLILFTLFQVGQDSNQEKTIQEDTDAMLPPELPKPIQPTETKKQYDAPIHEKILLDLKQIEQKAKPLLNAKSRNLMIDIDDIMQFMSQKIKASDDHMFKFEISDIQRTLNSYLTPALAHFSSLPSFLRDRTIEHLDKTPHQLIEQQLELILEELKKIAESIYMNDLNRLVDHGQFLKQKLQQETMFKVEIDPS